MMKRLIFMFLVLIAAGTCAYSQYQIFSAGANTSGQLGIGSIEKYNSGLNSVGGRAEWKSISSGENFSIAIKSDGTLWGWGNNSDYQLGNGTTAKADEPVQIGTDADWMMVSCGLRHTLALKSDGRLYAWGANNYGQLGTGDRVSKGSPQRITSFRFEFIAAGNNHSLAVQNNNTLFVWGDNTYGQIGHTSANPQTTPMQYAGVLNIKTVRAGYDFSLVLRVDGTLTAFGKNNAYQLGLGHNSNVNIPTQIGTAMDWADIQAGYEHCLAIKTNGTLWAWGNNSFGQIGNSSFINQGLPIQIDTNTWSKIAAFKDHNLAIKADSTLWSWGRNTYGQLANGGTMNQNFPAQVGDQKGWIDVSAGANASYALKYYPQLTVPILISPADKYSDAVSSMTFNWLPVTDASKYEIQISTDSLFVNNAARHSRAVIGLTSFTNNGFVVDEIYFWRVRAINSLDTSNWSLVFKFTTELSDLEMAWWHFSQTNYSAAIGIDTTSPNIFRVNNRVLKSGDAIGVFYLDGNISKCAGYLKWDGVNFGFTVWGDDDMTPFVKEGMSSGEVYTFKIWDSDTKTVYPAVVTYKSGFSSSAFANNAISVITSINSIQTYNHGIALDSGWNMVSSYIQPIITSFSSLLSPIDSKIIFAKDFSGRTYWKPFLQSLTQWEYHKAYSIKTNAKCTLNLTGTKIIPQNSQITLTEKGWHWIPYYRETSMSIEEALSSISGKFVLVKDMSGNVYWPQSVFTLSELTPGKGYMIYMSEPASLIYPANSGVSAKMSMDITENTDQSILTSDFRNTGESSILKVSVSVAKDGDIIGVYTTDNVCAGAASVKNETAVITIWADDFLTDEKEGFADNENLSLKLYRSGSNIFYDLNAYEIFDITNDVSKAAMEYNSNEIITAKAEISLSNVNEDSKESFLISPMPISSFANITLPSNFAAASVIKIYSTSGELVQEFHSSSNLVRIDFSNFTSGVYNIIISNGNDILSKSILVSK